MVVLDSLARLLCLGILVRLALFPDHTRVLGPVNPDFEIPADLFHFLVDTSRFLWYI